MDSERLPSGRHNIPRDVVVATQRSRMLQAMAESMMERGYVGTSVADITRRAGVSRETFYQQFGSKQDCFIQALDSAVDVLIMVLQPSVEAADGEPHSRFREVLRIYLDALAGNPAIARVFLVEVYAAGPEAMRRRREVQQLIADAIAGIFQAHTDDQRFACEALVAATAQLVTAHLIANDLDGLRSLEEPLAGLARRLLG